MATKTKIADYYDLLRIRRDATPDEISRAHRLMARKYHPDLTGDQDSDVFTDINVAYDTLSSPEKRAAYDLDLRQAEKKASKPVWGVPTEDAPTSEPKQPKSYNSTPIFTMPASPVFAQEESTQVEKNEVEEPEAPSTTSSKPFNPYTTQEKIFNGLIFAVIGFIAFIAVGRFTGMSLADASSATYSWFLTAGVLAFPALLFRNKFTIALAVFSLSAGAIFGMLSAIITPGFNVLQAIVAAAAWYGIFYSAKKPTFFS